jgi:hypothetical protein
LALQAENLNNAILDSLFANLAVLHAQGTIVAASDSWTRFAPDFRDAAPRKRLLCESQR